MRASRLLYRLLLILLGPLLLPLFIWQGLKHGITGYPKERLGFVPRRTDGQRPIWFHAASVGEVNAIIPLLRAFTSAHPEQPLLLTTTTISGFHNARKRIPEIEHRFLPFDFRHSVRRFINHIRPHTLFVVETEIWPTLFAECKQQSIPVEIINGRLSSKSLSSPGWVRQLYRSALNDVTAIAARSASDREAFITLGADPAKCQTLGNIKYAESLESTEVAPVAEMAQLDRPVVVAASTRDGEERLIAAGWRAADTGASLLVIVPRHPERLLDILKDLASYNVAIRSRGEQPTARTEIYLADTFGELKSFMAHSELVIIGGSFVPMGGQNLLEPAAMGRAIIVGPHMENFMQETQELLALHAVIQVPDEAALSHRLSELLHDPQQREELGKRARGFVKDHADIVERYLAFVERALGHPVA